MFYIILNNSNNLAQVVYPLARVARLGLDSGPSGSEEGVVCGILVKLLLFSAFLFAYD